MASLEGKVIAITGAGSGIGLATSQLLASRGAAVSISDIRQEPLEGAVAAIKATTPHAKIHHKVVDVAKANQVAGWLDETVTELGGLNGAANIAGVIGTIGHKGIKDLTDEDWDFVMDVNLRGVFNCLRAELQRMDEGASIVSMSSVAGLKGYSTGGHYSASKHAVIGLTKTAALEEGHRNIRVNCIAPGAIDTPMIQTISANSKIQLDDVKCCMKRAGRAEEVAKLVAFLLSDESSYTTGACYVIDGGYTA